MDHMERFVMVLEEKLNFTSTKRGLRTTNDAVATLEQTEMGLSYF